MGVDFGISETAMIGMAVAAAGAAANTAAQMKRSKEMDAVRKRSSQAVEARRKEALGAWEQGLSQLTPEQQRAAIDEESKKRMAAYTAAAGDVPQEMNIVKTSDQSPAIVKTEAAKQLGTKLDMARAQMAGQAKMAGFDFNTWLRNLSLNRTGEKVGMYGDFIRGIHGAASQDISAWQNAQPAVPLGDMLSAAGGAMMSVPKGAPTPTGTSWTADPRVPTDWYRAL